MQELKKITEGTGRVFLGKVVSSVLKYVSQIAVARIFGAAFFGIYTLGMVIYQITELLSRLGLQFGAVRYISLYRAKNNTGKLKGVLIQTIGFSFAGGLILGAIVFAGSEFLALELFKDSALAPAIKIFSLAVPFGSSMTVAAFATTAFKTTKYLVYVKEIYQPVTNLLFLFLFFLTGYGVYGALWAWFFSVSSALVLALYCIRQVFPVIIKQEVKALFAGKDLFKFSLPLLAGRMVLFAVLWVNTLILGYFRSVQEVGFYRAAAQTAFLLAIFVTSINSIFAPVIAEFFGKKNMRMAKRLFRTVTRWSFSLTLLPFLIMCINGREILGFFGAQFTVAWPSLVILSVAHLAIAFTGGVNDTLIMAGHHYLKVSGDFIMLVVNVVLNLMLIPVWGVFGAALATTISVVAIQLIRIIQVKIAMDMHPYTAGYAKTAFIGFIAAAGGFAVNCFLPAGSHTFRFFANSAVIFAIYAGLFLMLGLEGPEKAVFKKAIRKLCRKT